MFRLTQFRREPVQSGPGIQQFFGLKYITAAFALVRAGIRIAANVTSSHNVAVGQEALQARAVPLPGYGGIQVTVVL